MSAYFWYNLSMRLRLPDAICRFFFRQIPTVSMDELVEMRVHAEIDKRLNEYLKALKDAR